MNPRAKRVATAAQKGLRAFLLFFVNLCFVLGSSLALNPAGSLFAGYSTNDAVFKSVINNMLSDGWKAGTYSTIIVKPCKVLESARLCANTVRPVLLSTTYVSSQSVKML